MSISAIKAAFENQIVALPLDIIVPQRDATKRYRYAEFYKQLAASLKHVGLIEPLVVYRDLDGSLYCWGSCGKQHCRRSVTFFANSQDREWADI